MERSRYKELAVSLSSLGLLALAVSGCADMPTGGAMTVSRDKAIYGVIANFLSNEEFYFHYIFKLIVWAPLYMIYKIVFFTSGT